VGGSPGDVCPNVDGFEERQESPCAPCSSSRARAPGPAASSGRSPKSKLLDQLRETLRSHHNACFTHLSVKGNVGPFGQDQALSALDFSAGSWLEAAPGSF
jgi:hypothetical protein